MTYMSLIEKIFLNTLCSLMGDVRDDKLLKKIAIVVKQLREEFGKTQEEVYNETNIHIGRIETARGNPSVSTISALCKYFKIKNSEFFKMVEAIR